MSCIYPYGSKMELPIQEEISAVVKSKAAKTGATFYISDEDNNSPSSYDTARELGLTSVLLQLSVTRRQH